MRGWRVFHLLVLSTFLVSGLVVSGCGSSQDTAEDTTPPVETAQPTPPAEPPPPAVVEAVGIRLTVPNGLEQMQSPSDLIALAPPGTTTPPPQGTQVILITTEILDEQVVPSAMGCATLLGTHDDDGMVFNPEQSPAGFEASGVLGCESEGTITGSGGQLLAGYRALLLRPERIVLVLAMARLGEQREHFDTTREMTRAITFTAPMASPSPTPEEAPTESAPPTEQTAPEPAATE